MVVEVERVEELVLSAIQSTHHDDSLPSLDVSQDNQHSASAATFSTESAACCRMQSAHVVPQHSLITQRPCGEGRISREK
jgi:hypothetical protein